MNEAVQFLARRYALAYLHSFGDDLSSDVMLNLEQAKQFFFEHRRALYFLSLPTIAKDAKLLIMQKLFVKFHLPASMNKLVELLIIQKRTYLWYDILKSIIELYQQEHHIMDVVIESAPEIGAQQIEIIKQFLARKTGNDIIYKYRVNPDLIAGVRAYSSTILWECSIAKKLRAIRLSLIR